MYLRSVDKINGFDENHKTPGSSVTRVDRLSGDACPYVCPQTGLNQAQTNIALSQNMGFFNENMTWFFCVFRTIAVRLVGFFKNFGIVIVFNWLFQ